MNIRNIIPQFQFEFLPVFLNQYSLVELSALPALLVVFVVARIVSALARSVVDRWKTSSHIQKKSLIQLQLIIWEYTYVIFSLFKRRCMLSISRWVLRTIVDFKQTIFFRNLIFVSSWNNSNWLNWIEKIFYKARYFNKKCGYNASMGWRGHTKRWYIP